MMVITGLKIIAGTTLISVAAMIAFFIFAVVMAILINVFTQIFMK